MTSVTDPPQSAATPVPNQVHAVWRAAARAWFVVVNGADHGGPLRLKEAAVEDGRTLATRLRAELVVHNRDGRIAWCNSYGHDPHPPKG